MDIDIEKELSKIKSHIIDHATLSAILTNLGYVSIKDKIDNLKKKEMIETLKKGLYVHKSRYTNNIVSKEMIANAMLAPSYVSSDYALYYYGIIPESVHDVLSVTFKRSKSFITTYGTFAYKKIKQELYPIGIRIESTNRGNFLIASKEKALCDKIYFTNGIAISSKKLMFLFLEEDLRVDFEELDEFDINIVIKYYNITKSKKIKLLKECIEDLNV